METSGENKLLGRVWKKLTLFGVITDHIPHRCKGTFDHLWEGGIWLLESLSDSSIHYGNLNEDHPYLEL